MMQIYLLTALCAALAYAKPEYVVSAAPNIPTGGYGAPTGGEAAAGGGGGDAFARPNVPTGSYGAPAGGETGAGGGGGGSVSISKPPSSIVSGTQPTGFATNIGIHKMQAGPPPASVGFGQEFGGQVGSGTIIDGGSTLLQEYIYVPVAYPELQEVRLHPLTAHGQLTNYYKNILIKTPFYDIQPQHFFLYQARSDQRPCIYVLVRKPVDGPQIDLRSTAPTVPIQPAIVNAGTSASVRSEGQLIEGSAGLV